MSLVCVCVCVCAFRFGSRNNLSWLFRCCHCCCCCFCFCCHFMLLMFSVLSRSNTSQWTLFWPMTSSSHLLCFVLICQCFFVLTFCFSLNFGLRVCFSVLFFRLFCSIHTHTHTQQCYTFHSETFFGVGSLSLVQLQNTLDSCVCLFCVCVCTRMCDTYFSVPLFMLFNCFIFDHYLVIHVYIHTYIYIYLFLRIKIC